MAQTPLSTTTPYCSAAQLFTYHDPNQVADMLRDGTAARPSYLEMLDPTSTAGSRLVSLLKAGSGRIESYCLIGRRYTPEDLQALTGASQEMLVKLNADVTFWMLAQRRQPMASDPRSVPGALEAQELLKMLRDGETIFGFEEAADAGLPTVVQANPGRLLTPNVVGRAVRLFVNTYPNNLSGNEG